MYLNTCSPCSVLAVPQHQGFKLHSAPQSTSHVIPALRSGPSFTPRLTPLVQMNVPPEAKLGQHRCARGQGTRDGFGTLIPDLVVVRIRVVNNRRARIATVGVRDKVGPQCVTEPSTHLLGNVRECRLQPAPALLCALACHLGQFDRVGGTHTGDGVVRTQAMSQHPRAAGVLWLREPAVTARSRVRAWRWRRTPPALSLSRLDIAAAAVQWLWAPASQLKASPGLATARRVTRKAPLVSSLRLCVDMSCDLERPL